MPHKFACYSCTGVTLISIFQFLGHVLLNVVLTLNENSGTLRSLVPDNFSLRGSSPLSVHASCSQALTCLRSPCSTGSFLKKSLGASYVSPLPVRDKHLHYWGNTYVFVLEIALMNLTLARSLYVIRDLADSLILLPLLFFQVLGLQVCTTVPSFRRC